MVDRLSNLVAIFNTPALDFRGNRAEGDGLLEDAYEYLMRHFATESGKSKGQFYTPAAVSRVMAKLANPHFKNADGRLKAFDFVVTNFPFSNKTWSNGVNAANDLYRRFEFGILPAKNGDYALLLHILASLKSTGKGAVIHPHGVLFRGGPAR